MQKNVEKFLKDMRKKVKGLSKKEFEIYRESLKIKLIRQPQDLEQESERFWYQINCDVVRFDKREQCLNLLDTLNKKELLACFDMTFKEERVHQQKFISERRAHDISNRMG